MAGLALMRGVPLVAASPIHYDDHSSVSSQLGGPQAPPADGLADPTRSPRAGPELQQQQQPLEVHAYQPNWKTLIDYAHQHRHQANPHPHPHPHPSAGQQTTPPDRLNAASPRYQQLIGQVS